MNKRRDFIKKSFLAMGGLSVPGLIPSLSAARDRARNLEGEAPMRFIFMHRCNGVSPATLDPLTFDKNIRQEWKQMSQRGETYRADLSKHDLVDWMAPLEEHKSNLTILQNLSGMMCAAGHHAFGNNLGAYRMGPTLDSIKHATMDFELAKLFPSPLQHVALACFSDVGPNGRSGFDVIAKGFSAVEKGMMNVAYGSPKLAIDEIFKSVSEDENDQLALKLERNLLEFMSQHESRVVSHFDHVEKQNKSLSYVKALKKRQQQQRSVNEIADAVRKNVPNLEGKFLADGLNVFDRQRGHTEVLLSSLISGLTNVVNFTLDEMALNYTGVTGMEGAVIHAHDVLGHGRAYDGVTSLELRHRCQLHHMSLMSHIANRLKSVPEGKGSMFDNTTIIYFPDSGESHHSSGKQFPFIILSGSNTRLNISGEYVRLPHHGDKNHKTLGNFYTTILNAYGNPISHYGDFDVKLKGDQSGPIKEFFKT